MKSTMKRLTILSLASSLFFFSGLSADEFSFEDDDLTEFEQSLLSLDDEFFDAPAVAQEITQVQEVAPQATIQQEELAPVIEEAVQEVAEVVAEPILAEPEAEVVPEPVAVEEVKIEAPAPVKEQVAVAPLMQPELKSASKEVVATSQFNINLKQVFDGSPIIYTVLFLMSMATVFIWFYSLLRLRHAGAISEPLLKQIRQKLHSNQYDEAIALCTAQNTFFCKMLAAGIAARGHGLPMMVDTMKTEGKRVTVTFWQRLAFLNDIAMIAPMLGLLGTVLGMFYAFYDLNRSMESFSILFDGLGISVGTTVAGLIVAILALILHSLAKYRFVRQLVRIENEVQSFASLIDNKTTFVP